MIWKLRNASNKPRLIKADFVNLRYFDNLQNVKLDYKKAKSLTVN